MIQFLHSTSELNAEKWHDSSIHTFERDGVITPTELLCSDSRETAPQSEYTVQGYQLKMQTNSGKGKYILRQENLVWEGYSSNLPEY